MRVEHIGDAKLYLAGCLEAMRTMPSGSVDAIVTDPPYELGFMGKSWDATGIAYSVEMWCEALRVLKPGGHLLAFGGSRTYHRMVCAIEDAGFEIRDQIMWVYGSGFPKSRDVSKDIDYRGGAQLSWFGPWLREWREKRGISQAELAKHFPSKSGGKTGRVSNFELGVRLPTSDDFNLICKVLGLPFSGIEEAAREVIGKKPGDPERFKSFAEQDGNERRTFNNDITAPATDAARQWQGWGTALKPAHEPICVARKPLIGTVAANVLAHGTGALNIDACRVPIDADADSSQLRTMHRSSRSREDGWGMNTSAADAPTVVRADGRWPANLIHDGSDEVLAAFPQAPGQQGDLKATGRNRPSSGRFGDMAPPLAHAARGDAGSAARFFYCAKSNKTDRGEGNDHPTVKPTALMRYLVRMTTPLGGVVLDPFMGSGSTGKAAHLEGFGFVGVEREESYFDIAVSRIEQAAKQGQLFEPARPQPVQLGLEALA